MSKKKENMPEGQMLFDFAVGDEYQAPAADEVEKDAKPKARRDRGSSAAAKPKVAAEIVETVDADAVQKPSPAPPGVKKLRTAVLGWLLTQSPMGVGLDVPTRFSRFRSAAAAFWSAPRGGFLRPRDTVIVDVRASRRECFPECVTKAALPELLKELGERRNVLEAEIRAAEPDLKETNTLFDEIEMWNYSASANPEYHECLRRLEETQRSLYEGSYYERVAAARVASLLYLAVPTGAAHPDEIAEDWGLLYVDETLQVTVVKEPRRRECPEINMLHFIQNIAAGASSTVYFANGVRMGNGGSPLLTAPPARRWKPLV